MLPHPVARAPTSALAKCGIARLRESETGLMNLSFTACKTHNCAVCAGLGSLVCLPASSELL